MFQAEDGIRELVRSRGLGDVYKRQVLTRRVRRHGFRAGQSPGVVDHAVRAGRPLRHQVCLLYTSDAADERSSVDLGGRRIIKKKKHVVSATAHPP